MHRESEAGGNRGCDYKRVRLIPQGLPLAVSSQDTQVGDLVGGFVQPGGACLFEAGLQHMAMPALDHTRADG